MPLILKEGQVVGKKDIYFFFKIHWVLQSTFLKVILNKEGLFLHIIPFES